MQATDSLAKYAHKRMVVMRSDASVYDAIRALDSNHIGVIIVEDDQHVAGIVTDRDLALRVIGYELDPSDLTLHDVMTSGVATLPVTASEADAAQLMLERHVRRVPVMAGKRVVGLVTLDDLVLQGFDSRTLSDIVRAQLTEPSLLKDKGEVHPTTPVHFSNLDGTSAEERAQRRHRARAQLTHRRFIQGLMRAAAFDRAEVAEVAVEELLSGLIQRITADEAEHLLAQLPALLRDRLWFVRRGPNRNVTRASIEQRLSERLDLDPAGAAEIVVRLGRALRTSSGSGEVADIRAQLPPDMRSIFGND